MELNYKLLAEKFSRITGCNEDKALYHTEKYLRACFFEFMISQTAVFGDKKQPVIGHYIRSHHLLRKLSTLNVNGHRHYVWSVFQSFNERVFDIIRTGSNLERKSSVAKCNYSLYEFLRIEDIIMSSGTCDELAKHVYAPHTDAIERGEVDWVPIDLHSLGNYISNNLSIDRNTINPENRSSISLEKNLKDATRILMIAKYFDGEIPQVINESVFGRKYYVGPNLQNVSKVVRHAALGACWEYDIENCALAWKYDTCRKIEADIGDKLSLPATLEYLEFKSKIRSRLTEEIYGKDGRTDAVKQFITAIGFGATRTAAYPDGAGGLVFPALSSIITSKEKLDHLLADSWVREFIVEQKRMNRYIIDYCVSRGHDADWRKIEGLTDSSGKLKPNSVMAYLYQSSEREIMNQIVAACKDRKVLLTVHDCLYTRHKINLPEVRSILRQFGDNLNISSEEHGKYVLNASHIETLDPRDGAWDPRDYMKFNVNPTIRVDEGDKVVWWGNYDEYTNREELIEEAEMI